MGIRKKKEPKSLKRMFKDLTLLHTKEQLAWDPTSNVYYITSQQKEITQKKIDLQNTGLTYQMLKSCFTDISTIYGKSKADKSTWGLTSGIIPLRPMKTSADSHPDFNGSSTHKYSGAWFYDSNALQMTFMVQSKFDGPSIPNSTYYYWLKQHVPAPFTFGL